MCSDTARSSTPMAVWRLNPTLDWICALTPGDDSLEERGWTCLNPTLDWICALTYSSSGEPVSFSSLNPTLDWICALT